MPQEREEPSLLRGIGKVAWPFGKVAGIAVAFAASPIPIFRWNQTAGLVAFWSIVFGAGIVLYGYWNDKSGKKDLEWNRKWPEDQLKRDGQRPK